MHKKPIYRSILLFTLLTFIFALVFPISLHAQSYWGGRDRELIREWRERSNSINRRVDSLDEDRVENIPVPILFGITPDNLSRNFNDPRSGGRLHEGLDLMAPSRALIVSPTEAVVIRVGTGDSAGKYVYTANPGGETFAYLHLDEIADIDEGDELKKGDLIGYVGNTGNAIGGAPHLHFEIRFDREATDPYPRLTRIFPMKDKIEYLENILQDADDEEELAQSVVALYRSELALAQTLNIELPDVVTEALVSRVANEASSIERTLRIGSRGEDVRLVQVALGIGADGVFGPQTRAALADFQTRAGLVADGVFGANSRRALAGLAENNTAGCTEVTIYSPLTGAKCPSV